MSVQLLNEHHLEFLSLKGGCTGSSESTLVKMPHCWKSHVTAHICINKRHYIAALIISVVGARMKHIKQVKISREKNQIFKGDISTCLPLGQPV